MIEVKHPLEECNKQQQETVDAAEPEKKRELELLFSYGNTVYRYHSIEITPQIEDFSEWLSGLPEPVARNFNEKGFDGCKGVLSFRRYVREKRDIGLEEFIKKTMGKELFKEYLDYFFPPYLKL